MEQEQLKLFKKTFEEAYAWRANEGDVDWKPTQRKDYKTGQMVEGNPLAYLNWAVAWRTMVSFYPDANYRVIETESGSPLWDINGYGMVKCAVSAMGIEHVETFPIMQGGRNDSMKMEEIDGRDVNDSIQRGLTKAVARFGIGLYIYEGKLEAPKKVKGNPFDDVTHAPRTTYPSNPKTTAPVAHTSAHGGGCSPKQKSFIENLLLQYNGTVDGLKAQLGKDPFATFANATEAIDYLKNGQYKHEAPKAEAKSQEKPQEQSYETPQYVQRGLVEASNPNPSEQIIDDDLPF